MAARANTGARDPSPPRDDRPVDIPHQLYFADVSRVWMGGVAFVDHPVDPGAVTLARAYLMTTGQLSDVMAQESVRPLGSVELDPHLDRIEDDRTAVIGPGRYDTVLGCGEIDGVDCVTFTGRATMAETAITTPAADYLAMVAAGLRAVHGLDDEGVVRYLRLRPGVAGRWSDESLLAAISGEGDRS